MDLHSILAKPIQIMKEVLDLEPDLESPSLASQFVAIRHQLAEVQARLHESNRISHEKDVVISKLQKAMTARVQKPPAAATLARREEHVVPASPVRQPQQAAATEAREPIAQRSYAPEQAKGLQAEPDEEIKLPAVPCYQAPRPKARPVRTRVVAKTIASPVQATVTAKPSAQEATQAKAEKARSTRTRATRKTSSKAPVVAQPKKSTRAGKQATAEKAKPTRARTTAKKPAAKTRAKATAKPKRASRARKN